MKHGLTARLLGPPLVGLLFAVPASLAVAPLKDAPNLQQPDLSGSWVLNYDESDDPRQVMREAMERSGMRRGGGQGRRGRMRGNREQRQGRMGALMEATVAFEIVQDDSSVTFATSGREKLVLYSDGRKVKHSVEGFGTVETKARWKGDKLVVERQMPQGGKVTRTYRISEDGQRLYVMVKLEGGRMPRPIEYRQVYDAKADAGAG